MIKYLKIFNELTPTAQICVTTAFISVVVGIVYYFHRLTQ